MTAPNIVGTQMHDGKGLTFGGLVFDGLLEQGDVLERAEEQNHLVVLVPDGSDLHVEPDRTSCRTTKSQISVCCCLIDPSTLSEGNIQQTNTGWFPLINC